MMVQEGRVCGSPGTYLEERVKAIETASSEEFPDGPSVVRSRKPSMMAARPPTR